jgi:probable HAF family extracellular repeat protein
MKKPLLVLVSTSIVGLLNGCGTAIQLPPPVATHFSVTTASTPQIAGMAFNITVTALDASNSVVTSYVGTVHFASSDAQAVLPGDSTLPTGTKVFSVTLKTAVSQTITVTDTAGALTPSTSSSISVNAAATSRLSVMAPASASSGTAFNFTVTAQDQFSNTTTTYSGMVQFSSSDGSAALPPNATLTNGTRSFSATLKSTTNQTITVTDTSSASISGTSNSISVSPSALTHFSVTAPLATISGTAFSFIVTALDASNNVLSAYSGTVHFTSSDAVAKLPTDSALTNGTATFSATLMTSGNQTITAQDKTSITGISNFIRVSGPATHFSVSAPSTATRGRAITFTVTPFDASNNPAPAYSGSVHFFSTDGLALLPADTLLTGTPSFFVTFKTTGNQTITVTDAVIPTITGTSNTIDVTPPAPLVITSGQPPNGTVGSPYGTPVMVCHDGAFLYYFELTATGGISGRHGYSWSGSSLPPGLQVTTITFAPPNCPTGTIPVIEGTPTSAGTFTFSISVTDAEIPRVTTTYPYTITINTKAASATEKVPADESRNTHHHYKLFDVGTFGGPASQYSVPSSAGLNNRGTATGVADTSIPDPNCFFDCMVDHAFEWKNGVTTDLGTLPGGPSSFAYAVNKRGLIVGQSQIGSIDTLTGAPEVRGVLWRNGQVIDLGTLGGNASNANAINDRGQVVGAATNLTIDPFANVPQAPCHVLTTGLPPSCSVFTFAANSLFSASTTETRAFLWQDSFMRDLGTLGGPDSSALINNDRGEVAGWSYTSFVANPSTGVPTVDPFLWSSDDGKMTDLGSLGGTFGAPFFLNNRGQVIGVSNLAGDLIVHPFIWSKSEGMKDLGTLGGTYGHPNWINDDGEIVGFSDLVGDQTGHAFLWRDGVMTDLGTLGTDPASEAGSINSHGQIVGGTFIFGGSDLRGWLWENGGPIVDLEKLVLPGSGLTVIAGNLINDRGEIAGRGMLPNGHTHAILLIPCDEIHPEVEGCDYDTVDPETAVQLNPAPITPAPAASPSKLSPAEMMPRFRSPRPGRDRRYGTTQTSPR